MFDTTIESQEQQRVRRRMEELRKHHNDSINIHNRTQPMINGQIHEETLKYLNSTKTKTNQKPRVPKRQRNSVVTTPTNTTAATAGPVAAAASRIAVPPPQPSQPPPPPQPMQVPQHYAQQQQQQQQHHHHHQQHQHHHHQQQQQQRYQQAASQPQLYQPQQSHQPQQHYSNHYHSLHYGQHNYLQQGSHIISHAPFNSLPNDLDLNLQAGLECVDVDSLINHEMSVEGQLDFNHDLIQRILF